MSAPVWSDVDDDTADLLDLIADSEHTSTSIAAEEWSLFCKVLREVSRATGLIDPNAVRPVIRGQVTPQRIGAFWHRACRDGLICRDGWNVSDDAKSGNAGKPQRTYRWLGS